MIGFQPKYWTQPNHLLGQLRAEQIDAQGKAALMAETFSKFDGTLMNEMVRPF